MLGVVAISTAAVAIRSASALPPGWLAAGRVAITAVVLLPFCIRELGAAVRAFRASLSLFVSALSAAACLALHFGTWIVSLTMTTVVTSVALVATQPLFAVGFGRVLGDRVGRPAYVGAVVALGGGYVMSGAEVGEPFGALLALAGAFFAAAYLAVGRFVRDRVPLSGYFILVNAMAALMLAGWGSVEASVWEVDWASSWPYVVYLGAVSGAVGHGLLHWAVRRLALHVVSLLVLLEPVGAGLFAWGLLGEAPRFIELLGGAVMLLGVAIGVCRVPKGRASLRGGEPAS